MKRRSVAEDVIADAVAETMPETQATRSIGEEILESIRAIKRGEGKRRDVVAGH